MLYIQYITFKTNVFLHSLEFCNLLNYVTFTSPHILTSRLSLQLYCLAKEKHLIIHIIHTYYVWFEMNEWADYTRRPHFHIPSFSFYWLIWLYYLFSKLAILSINGEKIPVKTKTSSKYLQLTTCWMFLFIRICLRTFHNNKTLLFFSTNSLQLRVPWCFCLRKRRQLHEGKPVI